MSRRRNPAPKLASRAARPGPGQKSSRIRIVVADSQAIDRGGLVRLLEDECDVVGEAAALDETIQQCRILVPDVLVLSLGLFGQERDAAIPAIRAELPSLRILALADHTATSCLVLNPPSRQRIPVELKLPCTHGMDCLQLAVTQGAMATLRRSADPEELFRAIRAVAAGGAWYDPTTAAGLLSSTGPDSARADGKRAPFSQRELEVAALVAEGQSNKEISTGLRISETTVKKHVGHILEKLGLADRLQAGLFLARNPVVLKR